MKRELKALEFEKPIVELENKIHELQSFASTENINFSSEIDVLSSKCEELKKSIYGSLTPWQRVQLARHPNRPYTLDYIKALCSDFVELHGDRNFADDAAVVCGIARLDNNNIVVIGHQKGRSVHDAMKRNFGMPNPEGYRKTLRIMKLAERFNKPIICFIDTPGAYPGIGAEERGQATAIAENLREMANLKVPVICVIIGEGGSGGALAIGIGNKIMMLENAWYSVISPEGCAAILFRDASKAPQAAETLKLTAHDLKELNIIDEIIPEPLGGAHRDPDALYEKLKQSLLESLSSLTSMSADELIKQRKEKYRCIGAFDQKKINKQKSVNMKQKPIKKNLKSKKRKEVNTQ